MPFTWMAFPTGSSPFVKEFRNNPAALKENIEAEAQRIAQLRGNRQLGPVELYFDVGKEFAYALFENLGDSVATKAMSRKLGATGMTKLLRSDRMQQEMEENQIGPFEPDP